MNAEAKTETGFEPSSNRLAQYVDRLFRGSVAPWVYDALRIGLATIFIVRHADWLRPLVFLQHHLWVHGLDFTWSIQSAPYFVSPLVPGLMLTESATRWLVEARTLLSGALLLGIRPRAAALLLAVVSYVLLASDRYRYFHHLHLLYTSLAWLSLFPLGSRFSLEPLIRRAWAKIRHPAAGVHLDPPAMTPLWPLQMMRAFVVSVYLASGLSKLDCVFFSGETLEHLDRLHVLGGATWTALHETLGYSAIAKLTCLTELSLPALLLIPSTRHFAIIVAVLFHTMISSSMMVSTFGAQMAVLLIAFWPNSR